MKYPVYNTSGEQVKEADLSARLFGREAKPEVIHQVVVAQQANARQVLAHTKTRAEVSGGGKKPWKQKGTGRARHGSTRSPIWVGGGITFGPRNDRNFTLKVNKKQKQAALAMCLSDKAADKTLVLIDKLALDTGKTKDLNKWLKEIKAKIAGLKESKKILLITGEKDAKLVNSTRNLKNISVIGAASLNCVDLLASGAVIMSEKAVEVVEKHYKKIGEKKK